MSKMRTSKLSRKIKECLAMKNLYILSLCFICSINALLAQSDTGNKTVNLEETFLVVEEMPQYPGGEEASAKFIRDNIKYPNKEMKNGIQGLVIVSFIVEKDGSISNVKVLKSVTPALDAEAVRVISLMEKWIPGTQRGKAVRVQINYPIRFILN